MFKKCFKGFHEHINESTSNKVLAIENPYFSCETSAFLNKYGAQDYKSSIISQQISGMNHRYNFLGSRLAERQSKLNNTRDELTKCIDNFKLLTVFLDKVM